MCNCIKCGKAVKKFKAVRFSVHQECQIYGRWFDLCPVCAGEILGEVGKADYILGAAARTA